MSRTGAGRLLALLLLWPVAACAGRAIVPGPPSPRGAPDALRASLKGRLDHGGRAVRFQADIALVTPDRLRAEISGPVGGVKAVFAIRGGRVTALFPGTREYLDEPASPATFEALIGLPLEPEALIDLFNFAGGRGEDRLRVPAGVDGEPRLLAVHREPDRLSVTAPDPRAAGFSRLELKLSRGERPGPADLAEALFTLAIPGGWARLSPASADGSRPVLMP